MPHRLGSNQVSLLPCFRNQGASRPPRYDFRCNERYFQRHACSRHRALAFAEGIKSFRGHKLLQKPKKIYHLNLAAYHHIHDNPASWWRAYRNYNISDWLLSHIQGTSSSNSLANLAVNYQKNIHHGIASSIEKLNRVKFFKSKLQKALQFISPYTINNIACDLDFLCEALFIHGKLCIHKLDINQAETLYVKALEIGHWSL